MGLEIGGACCFCCHCQHQTAATAAAAAAVAAAPRPLPGIMESSDFMAPYADLPETIYARPLVQPGDKVCLLQS
jgi:hypothetical protein